MPVWVGKPACTFQHRFKHHRYHVYTEKADTDTRQASFYRTTHK
jgi:hypothetical protein